MTTTEQRLEEALKALRKIYSLTYWSEDKQGRSVEAMAARALVGDLVAEGKLPADSVEDAVKGMSPSLVVALSSTKPLGAEALRAMVRELANGVKACQCPAFVGEREIRHGQGCPLFVSAKGGEP